MIHAARWCGVLAVIGVATPVRATSVAPASQPASAPAEAHGLAAFRATQVDTHDTRIAAAAARWGIDPFLLKGLLFVESGLKARAVNERTGALGIAQFTTGGRYGVTVLRRRRGVPAREAKFTVAHALDPVRAIPAAAELLAHLIGLYGRDGGLTAYNTGPWGGVLVRRIGYWRARARVGPFLLMVLRQANRLRAAVGLPPLAGPAGRRPPPGKPRLYSCTPGFPCG